MRKTRHSPELLCLPSTFIFCLRLSHMASLRIIFAGSGEFGAPTLRALIAAGHEIVQVYSQPDRPAGRGRKLTPTPIAQLALEHNLPLARTANTHAEILPPAD